MQVLAAVSLIALFLIGMAFGKGLPAMGRGLLPVLCVSGIALLAMHSLSTYT